MTGKKDPLRLHFFGPRPARKLAVYVHGWSVDWSSRGLFTALAEHLAGRGVGSALFDLNDYDGAGNSLFQPLGRQAERLDRAAGRALAEHPGASLSLIAHSLGCVTAVRWLADAEPRLEKLVMLAPAIGEPAKRLRNYLSGRPDSRREAGGRLSFVRKNGTTTTLAGGYLEELDFDLADLYRRSLPPPGKSEIIVAEEDRLRQTPEERKALEELGARVLEGADHNFVRRRAELCRIVGRIFRPAGPAEE